MTAASTVLVVAGDAQQALKERAEAEYPRVLDRALPLGSWTGELAETGVLWRFAFRAQGHGPEWRIVITGTVDESTARVSVTTAPIRDQLVKSYGRGERRQMSISTRHWQVRSRECDELRQATESLLTEGIRLAQSEFGLDGPLFEVGAESIQRRIHATFQGVGHDARLVKRMSDIRDAAMQGRCGAR